MKISTKGRYALRMLADLAMNNGRYVSLKEIAERQQISKKYLEQIVPLLNNSGFLATNRGYQGGYMLKKAPEECVVGDILRITEGNLAPVACLEQSPNMCKRCKECLTLPVWEKLYELISDYLDSITLADIIASDKKTV